MIDPALFTVERLLAAMLDMRGDRNAWRANAEILPAYLPPCPTSDTRPRCVVRVGDRYLRHSKGPRQGHFWDIYGDDYITVELALIALLEAPAPPAWACPRTP